MVVKLNPKVKFGNSTFLGGRRSDPAGDALVALGRAELGRQVLVAGHAFARHPRIEEIGVEAHLHWNVRFQRQGFLKPAHRAMVLSDRDPTSLLQAMRGYRPVVTGKWAQR